MAAVGARARCLLFLALTFFPSLSSPEVYLLPDRLCYADSPDAPDITYLPLDGVPVRPLPRGYAPTPGVARLDRRAADLPAAAAAAFSVTAGDHTTAFVAPSTAVADGWVADITAAWTACVRDGGPRAIGGGSGGVSATAATATAAVGPPPPATLRYTISVVTSPTLGAGTDGEPAVELHGVGGARATVDAARVRLPAAPGDLAPGRAASYGVDLPPVGPLTAVSVSLRDRADGGSAGTTAPWLLDRVEVAAGGARAVARFPCSRWLQPGERVTLPVAQQQATEGATATLAPTVSGAVSLAASRTGSGVDTSAPPLSPPPRAPPPPPSPLRATGSTSATTPSFRPPSRTTAVHGGASSAWASPPPARGPPIGDPRRRAPALPPTLPSPPRHPAVSHRVHRGA